MKFSDVFELFREIEDEKDLFSKRIQGIDFWDILRVPLFEDIVEKKQIYNKRPEIHLEVNKTNGFIRLLFESGILIANNPIFMGRKNFLFFGPGLTRQRTGWDGKLWDIYCDPLIDAIGAEFCTLMESYDYPFFIKRDHHTKNTTYSNILGYIGKAGAKLGIGKVTLCGEELLFFEDLEQYIKATFDIDIDLVSMVKVKLSDHRRMVYIYKNFLTMKKPKVIFLVCSYGKESLVAAARQLSIPTIEIQHGTISPYHLAYEYPQNSVKKLFPDYYMSMGKYWEENTNFPIDKKNIITLGSPFITEELTPKAIVKKKQQIIFISQWTIGNELALFASEFCRIMKSSYKVFYKLHPGECADWMTEYPCLKDSEIVVVEGHQSSLHELLKESEFQVGVYSTAIFEGMSFGCKTFLVDLPGIEHMKPLVDKGFVKLVDDPRDINLKMSFNFNYEEDYFFSDNWQRSFSQFLESKGRFE